MASFTSLPQEIVDLILPLVNPNDYAACALVSRYWLTFFTPSLWRTIRVTNETTHRRLKTPQGRRALTRNIHHTREFHTTYLDFVWFLATARPTITNLVSLTIHLKDHRFSSFTIGPKENQVLSVPKSVISAVMKILENNPGLRSLSLDKGCFREKDDNSGFENLIAAIPTSHLERLELSFFDPTLTSRQRPYGPGSNTVAEFLQDVTDMVSLYEAQERFLALKEVAIAGYDVKPKSTIPHRMLFLLRCPNVERIRLDRVDLQTIACLPALLQIACPKLNCLEWTKGVGDAEEPLEKLIRATSLGWKEMRLPDMYGFGFREMAALLETSAETLEVLRIEGSRSLLPNDTLNLLSSAKRLRRLEGPSDGQVIRITVEQEVDAYEAYQEYVGGQRDRSWVLGPSMEYLQLSIQRVPRPDVVCRRSGQGLTWLQEGLNSGLRFEVQRWIYNQLSRMTYLQELVVGKMDFNQGMLASYYFDPVSMDSVACEEALLERNIRTFSYLSMEFSLESGLDILEGMKELRVLDVRRTAHNIGVEELKWMHVNWPKLEKIRGLETERGWSVHRGEGKEFKAGVDAWMAAHPCGIGSSFYSQSK